MKPPIPSPIPDPEPLSFRFSFWHMFTVCYAITVVITLPVVGPGSSPNSLAIAFLTAAVAELIGAAIAANIFKTVINGEGVRGYDFWARPAKLSWHEIATVKRTNFIGLKYLKLSSQTRKNVMWLPLFLSDKPGFQAAIKEYTDEQNPLWQYFK